MSDRMDRPDDMPDLLDDAELELITDYLTRQLPPDRLAEVKQRLERDTRFRDLAEPLVQAWAVQPLHVRDPMPRSELVKHWNDFRHRAGMVAPRPRIGRRALWLLVAILAGGISIYSLWAALRPQQTTESNRQRAADSGMSALHPPLAPPAAVARADTDAANWLRLRPHNDTVIPRQGVLIAFRKNASIRMRVRDTIPDLLRLSLTGSARVFVRRQPSDSGVLIPTMSAVTVETSAGSITCMNGAFDVEQRHDTTIVTLLERPLPEKPLDLFDQFADFAFVASRRFVARHVQIYAGERALIVVGRPAIKLPPLPETRP